MRKLTLLGQVVALFEGHGRGEIRTHSWSLRIYCINNVQCKPLAQTTLKELRLFYFQCEQPWYLVEYFLLWTEDDSGPYRRRVREISTLNTSSDSLFSIFYHNEHSLFWLSSTNSWSEPKQNATLPTRALESANRWRSESFVGLTDDTIIARAMCCIKEMYVYT